MDNLEDGEDLCCELPHAIRSEHADPSRRETLTFEKAQRMSEFLFDSFWLNYCYHPNDFWSYSISQLGGIQALRRGTAKPLPLSRIASKREPKKVINED